MSLAALAAARTVAKQSAGGSVPPRFKSMVSKHSEQLRSRRGANLQQIGFAAAEDCTMQWWMCRATWLLSWAPGNHAPRSRARCLWDLIYRFVRDLSLPPPCRIAAPPETAHPGTPWRLSPKLRDDPEHAIVPAAAATCSAKGMQQVLLTSRLLWHVQHLERARHCGTPQRFRFN